MSPEKLPRWRRYSSKRSSLFQLLALPAFMRGSLFADAIFERFLSGCPSIPRIRPKGLYFSKERKRRHIIRQMIPSTCELGPCRNTSYPVGCWFTALTSCGGLANIRPRRNQRLEKWKAMHQPVKARVILRGIR